MVNDRFPNRAPYGFEIVSGVQPRLRSRQSNIYGESNRSNFSQIFGELDVARIREIYPRLVFKAQIANSIATG
ncbi:MAG: hypothetical protein BGP05_06230 [Rhizobiales bacterium 62-47]|nr:MAG: hypothetical protein BGP05_06230 [Rhizobiales bacterium 62-47]